MASEFLTCHKGVHAEKVKIAKMGDCELISGKKVLVYRVGKVLKVLKRQKIKGLTRQLPN